MVLPLPAVARFALLLAAAMAAGVAGTPLRAQQPSPAAPPAVSATAERPFGTLREQAARQQRWLAERLDRELPALMREHGVDMWVIPMREYNEDPVFPALVSPTTFAARRRTIYVFHDRGPERGVERIALGGTSQGGLYDARAAAAPPAGPAGGAARRAAELWGDEQWTLLRDLVAERNPRRIAINVSRTHAFSDGLSAGERDALVEALGPELASRLAPAELLPLDLLTVRGDDEAAAFRDVNRLAWDVIQTAFSRRVVTPGETTTQDVVWWMRQRLADLGLATWFQPSVSVQRRGWTDERLGANPVIQPGDVLWCDFGITAMGLNTDTQHLGYVPLPGETDAPAGLRRRWRTPTGCRTSSIEELRGGRSGNEILARRARAHDGGGAGRDRVLAPGGAARPRRRARWWGGGMPRRGCRGAATCRCGATAGMRSSYRSRRPCRSGTASGCAIGQEEGAIVGGDGVARWAHRRQSAFHLVR
jgi:hypothetical protein